MEPLITSCALLALTVCSPAYAQQFAPSTGFQQQGVGRFVPLSQTSGHRIQPRFGASVVPVALVEAADATPFIGMGVHAPPARLPGPAVPTSGSVAPRALGRPELVSAYEATWRSTQHSVPAQEVSFGADQKLAGCDKDCKGKCCCPPPWAHRSGLFGELLYLRARDSEVAFALPVNGAIPIGPVGVLDQDYSTGFRAGFSHCLDECTSLVATYSHFESSTFNFIDTNPTPALRGLLLHPATANAAADFLTASGNYDIDFELVDIDYRSVLFAGDSYAVNYSVGARYAHLDQDMQVVYTNAGTTDTVITDIDFDGAGIRVGLDAERHSGHHGFLCYGKAFASFVGGEFRADYDHGDTADPSIVDTAFRAGRLVTMLDLELGVGWQSRCGHYRLTTGYVVSAWLNTVNTDEWVDAVRNNNFVGLDDRMSFDGLTARAEYRY